MQLNVTLNYKKPKKRAMRVTKEEIRQKPKKKKKKLKHIQNKKEQTIAILAMQWWYHSHLLCDKTSTAKTKSRNQTKPEKRRPRR
jgi:hypothetical protein